MESASCLFLGKIPLFKLAVRYSGREAGIRKTYDDWSSKTTILVLMQISNATAPTASTFTHNKETGDRSDI